MMEVLAEIRQRYSCRAYQDRPVEQEKLDRVLEAARLAPSARNMQEWRFVVVRDAQLRRQLVPAANMQEFVGQAPVVIVACAEQAEYRMRCGQLAHPIDVAIALEHMALQAVREGLATCWIGSFFPDQVRNVLGIPEHISLVELLPLGYPADKPKPKSRVAMEKIVCYDRWSL
jgi:nitroreductase